MLLDFRSSRRGADGGDCGAAPGSPPGRDFRYGASAQRTASRPVPSRRDAVAAAAARSATTAGSAGVGKLLTALMGPIAQRVLWEPERKRSAPPPRA